MDRRRWLRWTYVVLAALVSLVVLVPNARLYRSTQSPGSVVAQLRHLHGELRSGAGDDMQDLFPEGYFFTHALYGLAWIEVAYTDVDLHEEALREARWALERLDSAKGREPFAADQQPAHGVFYTGWSSRLRGGVIELAGPEAPEVPRFEEDCEALAEAFGEQGPFLEAYPGEAWPVTALWLSPRSGCTTGCWTRSSRRW